MVKRLIKQIVAIFIAIAFVASIMFFIPKVPNSTPFTYEILVPNNMINSSSPLLNRVPLTFSGQNMSAIGGVYYTPISDIISSTNATNLMQFTNAIVSQNNITYNESSGQLECLYSTQFLAPLCSNATYEWLVFYSSGDGFSLYNGNGAPLLSSVNLKQLEGDNITMLLVYTSLNNGGANASSGIPLLP
ncbi:MAG: hypothetical protein M1433_01465 [Candidatus Parvarchaeota archaeon]|nr:hypothetical protein [Candidatus Parvarchaeota archaeon]